MKMLVENYLYWWISSFEKFAILIHSTLSQWHVTNNIKSTNDASRKHFILFSVLFIMNLLMKGPTFEEGENDLLLLDHVPLAAAAMTSTDQIVET